jgi:CheY-like chemotaxis protein
VALDFQEDLEAMGYRVVGTAATGAEAAELARRHRPDAVLMDIVLRGAMDGAAAAEHIGHGIGIPVIFLTAYSDATTVRRAAQTAPYRFLNEPYQSTEQGAAGAARSTRCAANGPLTHRTALRVNAPS